jgi:hypothetical protein
MFKEAPLGILELANISFWLDVFWRFRLGRILYTILRNSEHWCYMTIKKPFIYWSTRVSTEECYTIHIPSAFNKQVAATRCWCM